MTNIDITDGKTTQCARGFVTFLMVATLIYTVVFNGLAGPGAGPFTQSTGNVSNQLYTCITPAGFTFSIWSVIYICLFLIVIYAITLLFRKIDGEPAWTAGGAISIPFMLMLVVNLNLNVGWLFAWDAVNVTGSAILLILIAITNAIAVSLSAYSFNCVATSLYKNSKMDFWLGLLSINGFTLYVTWTVLASLINLTAFFIYQVEVEGNGVCTGILAVLLVAFIVWFILENTLLQMFASPTVTHYLVVIWAMVGVHSAQKDKASNEVMGLIIAIMTLASIMFVVRVALYRNRFRKFYSKPNALETDVQEVK